jgi:CRISPR-associated protein Cas2
MFVLIAYDVAADRTELLRKLLTRYLVHEQNSVFAGVLTEATYRKMVAEIGKVARPADRILQFKAADRHNIEMSCLTKNPENGALQLTPMSHHASKSVVI